MTPSTKAAFLAALFFSATSARAADGIHITQKTTIGDRTEINQVQIEKDRMRAEMSIGRGGKQAIIFDGTKQVMWMIDAERKTYREMTKADVDQMAGQMASMRATMQEQMKNLPPEQRARMEAMMAGRGAAPEAATKIQYRKTGTDMVGKWPCVKYDGYRDDKKVSEVCTVDPRTLGFAMDDFQVTKELMEFFGKLVPGQSERMFEIGTGENGGFAGVPVRTVFLAGQQPFTNEITGFVRESFAPGTFDVPAGLQKESMFGGRGRGRQ